MASESSSMPALPGFDDFLRRDVDRAGAQSFRAPQYNAVNIRRDYPQVYDAVGRALFFYRLPIRTCADLFQMSSNCVSAIRDQMIAASASDARAAFLINSRRQSQRDIVLARLTDAIAEKLSDASIVADMTVDDLVSILKRLEDAPPARNGTDRPAKQANAGDPGVIDVSQYEDVIDGLDAQKKSAAGDSGEDCSTTSTDPLCTSVEMSNRGVVSDDNMHDADDYDDIQDSLCNSLCSHGDSAAGSVGASPVPGPAALIPPGAGGHPGARAPGV